MIILKAKLLRHGQINFVHVPVISLALVSITLSILTTTATGKYFKSTCKTAEYGVYDCIEGKVSLALTN